MNKKALILVDLQNDFMPGGALAVENGDQVIPVANKLQSAFDLIVASQDWHPANHGSFAANHPGKQPGEVIQLNGLDQILWPEHCIQETDGAAFAPDLDRNRITKIFFKGVNPDIDSYSTFFDNGRKHSTGLADYFREKGIEQLYIMGLATDYCVKFSALDAVDLGFNVVLIQDGCRGVELSPGDTNAAVREMQKAGVTLSDSDDILRLS